MWDHAAVFLDRSWKLVGLQLPAACATRARGDSDHNFKNNDLFHVQSRDTGCCVHARSGRANWDVGVMSLMRWTLPGGNPCVVDGPLWVPRVFALLDAAGRCVIGGKRGLL